MNRGERKKPSFRPIQGLMAFIILLTLGYWALGPHRKISKEGLVETLKTGLPPGLYQGKSHDGQDCTARVSYVEFENPSVEVSVYYTEDSTLGYFQFSLREDDETQSVEHLNLGKDLLVVVTLDENSKETVTSKRLEVHYGGGQITSFEVLSDPPGQGLRCEIPIASP